MKIQTVMVINSTNISKNEQSPLTSTY